MAAILSWSLCILRDTRWNIIPRLPHWVRLNIISQLSHFAHIFIRRGSLSCEKYPTFFFSLLHAWYDIQFNMHNTSHEVRCLTTLFPRCYIYSVFLGTWRCRFICYPSVWFGCGRANHVERFQFYWDTAWIDNFVNGFQWNATHQRPNNNTFRTQRDISSWYVAFGYQDGKVGSCLVNNPTPCEIVRPSGKMAGSHFHRAVTAFHWIAIGVNVFWCEFNFFVLYTGDIACNPLLVLSEKLHWRNAFFFKPAMNR